MKKISKTLATILLLVGLVFLGGEWPDKTPLKRVLTYDSIAFATVLACGIYLKKMEEEGNGR